MNTIDNIMELHLTAVDREVEYRTALHLDVGVRKAGLEAAEAELALRAAIEQALEPTPEQMLAKGWQPIKCPVCGDVSAVAPKAEQALAARVPEQDDDLLKSLKSCKTSLRKLTFVDDKIHNALERLHTAINKLEHRQKDKV